VPAWIVEHRQYDAVMVSVFTRSFMTLRVISRASVARPEEPERGVTGRTGGEPSRPALERASAGATASPQYVFAHPPVWKVTRGGPLTPDFSIAAFSFGSAAKALSASCFSACA